MIKIVIAKVIIMAVIIFIFGCSTGKKEKIINPITLIKNGNIVSVRANESFFKGELIINCKIKAENIKAGENIPQMSIQTIKEKTVIKFMTGSSEIAAGEEIFTLNNCTEEIIISEINVINDPNIKTK